jgi:hypothetical protein
LSANVVTPIKQQPQSNNSNSNGSATGNGNGSCRSGSPAIESIGIDGGSIGSMGEWEPPRALWPTEWKVRPSTAEEREELRRQERMRYAAPHKAFTYRMHGYASVVGPVKGIYQHNVGKLLLISFKSKLKTRNIFNKTIFYIRSIYILLSMRAVASS